jgi:hypothetical protein
VLFKPKSKVLAVFAAKSDAAAYAEEQTRADTDATADRYVVFVQRIR